MTLESVQELGSISARVLINQSVRACELGKLLLIDMNLDICYVQIQVDPCGPIDTSKFFN